MARLLALTLHNIRNIGNGEITFETLPSAGSVTGIYGANGSGKTSVLDAIRLLRPTISGEPLPEEATELVSIGESEAELSALFRVRVDDGERYLKYTVVYRRIDNVLRIAQESVCVSDSERRLGRPFVRYTADERNRLDLSPITRWQSIVAAVDDKVAVALGEQRASLERRSFLFSDTFLDYLRTAAEGGMKPLAKDVQRWLAHYPSAFAVMKELQSWARTRMFLLSTQHNSIVSYNLLPISVPSETERPRELVFSMGDVNNLNDSELAELNRSLGDFNQIMPYLVHDMTLKVRNMGTTILPDGSTANEVVLMSVRDGVEVPLMHESEGVTRIVGMLAYLIRAYNDPDVLVTIDELDGGVFEYLLGEMLHEFSRNAQGQLIFTAHNLRPMERMDFPQKTIVLSTLDPNHRFIPYMTVGRTNNPRRQYIQALQSGGKVADLYKCTSPQMLGVGFTLAGGVDERTEQDVEHGLRSLEHVPTNDLERML
ncbi:DNA repair ATPase [Bifidobacterium italicum]|uniref:DNA repair ATPase n=1 Tax=Bifidobacterium italicum TaxID=1960968 RepID=A0A2A2EI64_9BIFI|nr:AAA family ATPase [Bifidobacterium italicum]PAU68615.1 DNA repair ATPase [Bifidobacterium italicum]